MAEDSELERDLRQLEASLRKLETEYNMYFGGTLPRPPVESRTRVERLFRRYDRAYIQSYADRFRLNSLQARFSKFIDLWDRAQRAREEGRPGPFSRPGRPEPPPPTPEPVTMPEAATAPEPPTTLEPATAPEPATTLEPATTPERTTRDDGVVCIKLVDPRLEKDKVVALYESLVEARRTTGNEEPLAFSRFAQMIDTQVARLRDSGSTEVAFRVSVKDHKVAFTAKGVRKEEE